MISQILRYKHNKRRSNFLGGADFGHCASRNLKHFGYKLVRVSTLFSVPIFYDLVPANTDERQAAEAVIEHFICCDNFGDKGFSGPAWQTRIFDQTGNLIWTPRRANQKLQNSRALNCFLSSKRERIEGVFYEIQDLGRNIERLLAKTILGLTTCFIAKMTSHLCAVCYLSILVLMFNPLRFLRLLKDNSYQMYHLNKSGEGGEKRNASQNEDLRVN